MTASIRECMQSFDGLESDRILYSGDLDTNCKKYIYILKYGKSF